MTDQHHPGPSAAATKRRWRIGNARTLLRTITWTGAGISLLALIGGIAGLATVETLGSIPDNDWAGIGLSLFIAAAFLPFVTWLVHLAVSLWVDDNQQWGPPRYGTTVSVLGTIAYGMLAAALLAFVLVPLIVALTPNASAEAGELFAATVIGLMLASITVAAIAGGIAVAGHLGIILGIVLGIGFAATAYGIYTETHLATWAGVAALVASTIGYLLAGQRRHRT